MTPTYRHVFMGSDGPQPRPLGERAFQVEGDGLTLNIDVAGLLPVAAHGGVVQASANAMSWQANRPRSSDHLRGDVPIDQARPERASTRTA